MINPVLVRSFCTLVEVGHFTRSAERLNMTSSSALVEVSLKPIAEEAF